MALHRKQMFINYPSENKKASADNPSLCYVKLSSKNGVGTFGYILTVGE